MPQDGSCHPSFISLRPIPGCVLRVVFTSVLIDFSIRVHKLLENNVWILPEAHLGCPKWPKIKPAMKEVCLGDNSGKDEYGFRENETKTGESQCQGTFQG